MELDFRKLVILMWKQVWLIAIVTIAGAALAFIYTTYYITPVYTSAAKMYVANRIDRDRDIITSADVYVSKALVETCIVILQSDRTLGLISQEVAQDTGVRYTPAALRGMISASSLNETEAFEIRVTTPIPEHSQLIADSILKRLPGEVKRILGAGAVAVIDRATLPIRPSAPNIPRNTILGAILSMLLTIAVFLLVELFDTRVKSEKDLTDLFDLPIIGVVPSLQQEE